MSFGTSVLDEFFRVRRCKRFDLASVPSIEREQWQQMSGYDLALLQEGCDKLTFENMFFASIILTICGAIGASTFVAMASFKGDQILADEKAMGGMAAMIVFFVASAVFSCARRDRNQSASRLIRFIEHHEDLVSILESRGFPYAKHGRFTDIERANEELMPFLSTQQFDAELASALANVGLVPYRYPARIH